MAVLIISGFFLLSLAVQGSVLALAGPNGTHPDIVLVGVVAFGILGGMRNGALVGLAAGLIQDILFGSPLGFFGAIKMMTGAIAGMVSDDIYKDVTIGPMVLTIFFTFFSDLLTFLLMKLFNLPLPLTLFVYLKQYTLARILMHFFLMGLFYPYLYRAQKRQMLFVEDHFSEE